MLTLPIMRRIRILLEMLLRMAAELELAGGYSDQVSQDGVIDADISSRRRNALRDGNDRIQQ